MSHGVSCHRSGLGAETTLPSPLTRAVALTVAVTVTVALTVALTRRNSTRRVLRDITSQVIRVLSAAKITQHRTVSSARYFHHVLAFPNTKHQPYTQDTEPLSLSTPALPAPHRRAVGATGWSPSVVGRRAFFSDVSAEEEPSADTQRRPVAPLRPSPEPPTRPSRPSEKTRPLPPRRPPARTSSKPARPPASASTRRESPPPG